jgi:hypothetical protein
MSMLRTKVRRIAPAARWAARLEIAVLAYLACIGAGLGLWGLVIAKLGTRRNHEGVRDQGRLTLERVTFYVSAKTLEGALARAAMGTSTVTTLTRRKALIGTWLWLRSRRTPDAPTQCGRLHYDRGL